MRTAHIDAVDRREGREFFHHASHEWGERHPERCSKSSQTALGWTRGEKVAQGKLVNLVENVRKEYWSFRVSGGNKGPLRPILEPVVGLALGNLLVQTLTNSKQFNRLRSFPSEIRLPQAFVRCKNYPASSGQKFFDYPSSTILLELLLEVSIPGDTILALPPRPVRVHR